MRNNYGRFHREPVGTADKRLAHQQMSFHQFRKSTGRRRFSSRSTKPGPECPIAKIQAPTRNEKAKPNKQKEAEGASGTDREEGS